MHATTPEPANIAVKRGYVALTGRAEACLVTHRWLENLRSLDEVDRQWILDHMVIPGIAPFFPESPASA